MLKEETPPMQQCNTQREGQDVSKIINIVTIKNVVIGEGTALPENYYDSLNSEELGTIGAISDFTKKTLFLKLSNEPPIPTKYNQLPATKSKKTY